MYFCNQYIAGKNNQNWLSALKSKKSGILLWIIASSKLANFQFFISSPKTEKA